MARSTHVPGDVLARETAMALADFVGDDASLLIASQRILARQPTSGVMTWLIAHILGAPNQRRALWEAVEELEADQTASRLAHELPEGATVCVPGWCESVVDALRTRGDISVVAIDTDGAADHLVDRLIDLGNHACSAAPETIGQAMGDCSVLVIELLALGSEMALSAQGALGAAAVARHWDIPVWAIAPTGSVLPSRMYDGLTRRWHENEHAPLWEREAEEIPVGLIDVFVGPEGAMSLAEALATSRCPVVPELF